MTEAAASPATALLLLWNDVATAMEAAYNEWHAGEHVPERLTVPGFLWGRRYADERPAGRPRYLTIYGLRDAAVLDSAPYRRLLQQPTPASARMRPALCAVSRWVCVLQGNALASMPSDDAGLALWVGEDEAAAQAARARLRALRPELSCWQARRLADAAPLPWLAPGQARDDTAEVRGSWVLGAAAPDVAPLAALGARLYRALPVAGSASRLPLIDRSPDA